MAAGEAERLRFWRHLAAWVVVSLANCERVIQTSLAAGKAPEPFTLDDVLGPEDDAERR